MTALFHSGDAPIKRAPLGDKRHEITSVFDHAGVEHRLTFTNAREAVRQSNWTFDPNEAAERRANPLTPVRHAHEAAHGPSRDPSHVGWSQSARRRAEKERAGAPQSPTAV